MYIPPSASSVINRRDIFHVRSNFQVIIINVSLDSDSEVSHLFLSFFHVLTYYILRSIFLFFLIISSPKTANFYYDQSFHPLSSSFYSFDHLTRAQEGEEEHTRRNGCAKRTPGGSKPVRAAAIGGSAVVESN